MKKKIIIWIIIVVVLALLVAIIYPVVYNKYFKKDENIKNKEVKKVEVINKFISNKAEKENIIFNSDNTYTYHYLEDDQENTVEKDIKGKYKKDSDNSYILDDKYKFVVKKKKLYFNKDYIIDKENLTIDEEDTSYVVKTNKIYFDALNIDNEINNITSAIKTNLGELQKEENLAEIESLSLDNGDVSYCFKYGKDNSMTCQAVWNVKLVNYNKAECDKEIDNDASGKFAYYAISSGECLEDSVTNGAFLTLEEVNNNYKVKSTFSGL